MTRGHERTADSQGSCCPPENQPGPGTENDSEQRTSGGEGGPGVQNSYGQYSGVHTGEYAIATNQNVVDNSRFLTHTTQKGAAQMARK